MLSQLDQRDAIRHGNLGVNKSVVVVQNSHVHRQVIPSLRLRIAFLCDSRGHHVEDEVNVSDGPLWCHNVSLGNFLRTATSSLPISVIMRKYPRNIWGSKGGRVTSEPSYSIRK